MNREDIGNKKKKPVRTFGEEQTQQGTSSVKASVKKVDKAIRKPQHRPTEAEEVFDVIEDVVEDVIEDVYEADEAWDVPQDGYYDEYSDGEYADDGYDAYDDEETSVFATPKRTPLLKKAAADRARAIKEAKAAKKAAEKEAKEAERAARAAEKEAERAAREAEREAEKAAKAAEKEAAKEAERAAKEAAKEAERAAKAAEKEAAKEAERAAKEAAKEAEKAVQPKAKPQKAPVKTPAEKKIEKAVEPIDGGHKEVSDKPQKAPLLKKSEGQPKQPILKKSANAAEAVPQQEQALPKQEKELPKQSAEPKKKSIFVQKPAKKKQNKKKQTPKETFIRIGHGIRSGSVTVTRYAKGSANWLDRFVAGEVNITPPKGSAVLDWLGERMSWVRKMGFPTFLLIIAVLIVVLLTFFNNSTLMVENVTVSIAGLSDDLEGYTICLISDLHGRKFGSEQAKLLRAINGEKYDMMLIAGDMVGADGDPQPFYDLLDGLSGNKPVYFVAGDSDPGPIRSTPNVVEGKLEEFVLEDWILGAVGRGAIYVDSPESLTVDDSVIWLTPESMLNVNSSTTLSALNKQAYQETNEVLEGLAIGYQTLPFTAYRQQTMEELQNRILEMKSTDLHISLGHMPPNNAPRVSDGSDGYLPTVDLLVAGHYCGGVWQLPIVGAVYIPAPEAPRHGWFPSGERVEGLQMLGGTTMYVSGGLGVTDRIYLPDFRFNNQPKITLLHLTAKLTDDLLGLNN